MARKLRLESEGGIYHVINRATSRRRHVLTLDKLQQRAPLADEVTAAVHAQGPIRRRHVLTFDKLHWRAPLADEVDARLRQSSGAARPPSTPKKLYAASALRASRPCGAAPSGSRRSLLAHFASAHLPHNAVLVAPGCGGFKASFCWPAEITSGILRTFSDRGSSEEGPTP